MAGRKGCERMPSYHFGAVAKEVINVLAKYNIPIHLKNRVYEAVDDLLSYQEIQPTEISPTDQEQLSLMQKQLD